MAAPPQTPLEASAAAFVASGVVYRDAATLVPGSRCFNVVLIRCVMMISTAMMMMMMMMVMMMMMMMMMMVMMMIMMMMMMMMMMTMTMMISMTTGTRSFRL